MVTPIKTPKAMRAKTHKGDKVTKNNSEYLGKVEETMPDLEKKRVACVCTVVWPPR